MDVLVSMYNNMATDFPRQHSPNSSKAVHTS